MSTIYCVDPDNLGSNDEIQDASYRRNPDETSFAEVVDALGTDGDVSVDDTAWDGPVPTPRVITPDTGIPLYSRTKIRSVDDLP